MPVRYEKGDDGIVTLTFDAPGAPVNTMTAAWQEAFTAAVARLEKEKNDIVGVILCSAKKTFFAGAELKDVIKLTEADGPRFFEEIEKTKRQFRALEKLGRPVVAALEGAALGGGWELALAAHCRICLNDERIQLGLPEATLGLLPGAGGVTKHVRLLGLQVALPLLMEGKPMRPQEAAKLGLLQGLASNREDLFRMAREWIAKNPAPKQPWDEENYRIPGGTPASPQIAQMLTIAPAILIEKTRGLYPAPEAIMAAAVEGASVDFDTALRIESRYIAKLAVGQVAKNMISLFFNRTAIRAGASRPKDVPKSKATKVGILGAGMMGGGIAWANASRGIACVLKDVTLEQAQKGKTYGEKLAAKRNRLEVPALITPSASAADLQDCDLIIEAVFEKRGMPRKVDKNNTSLI
jgi:3-hydroxyacyl-CoA dehydrogenase/enoyl-CoA hydratase/3-hydroxybutyryl-CoA epimerase